MRAVRFDGDGLVLDPKYPLPDSDEALVRVSLAGICGTDLEILRGYMSYAGVPGHEFVGTVVRSPNPDLVGKRVVGEINAGCRACELCLGGMERHCPGRTVLGILKRDGAFAEYLCLPERNLHVLPDSISDEQAVFVEPLAAALEIKEQVALDERWKVAVVGDGRLAQLISQVLVRFCPDTYCFGRHRSKLDMLVRLGVRTCIGIKPDIHHSFDLVVEATGRESGLSDALDLVRPRGTVILKSTISSRATLDLTRAVVNEVTLVGSRCGLFKPAIDALAAGVVYVDYLADSTYPLEEFHSAFEHAKKPGTMKVFLRP